VKKRIFTEGAQRVKAERLAELERLERELEDATETHKLAQVEFRKISAQILRQIQEKRLYKTAYSSFAAYCEDRWGYQKTYAYDLIQFAKEIEQLSANADTSAPPPETEGEARAKRKQEKAADRTPQSNSHKKRPEFNFEDYGDPNTLGTLGAVEVRLHLLPVELKLLNKGLNEATPEPEREICGLKFLNSYRKRYSAILR
jgi:hypothetical protein